ncbi:MAG: hypothetical protein U0174_01760 [Polyangiaceae bacterium]
MKKTPKTDSSLAFNLRRVRKPVKTQINTGGVEASTRACRQGGGCGYSCVSPSA